MTTTFPRIAAIALIALSLTGCASGVPTETTNVISGNDILTADLSADLTARGVVLAAVLLVAGDIEVAVSNGPVTPAEVDAAQKAIDEGTLDLWRQRAEAE